jgi:hypothetical protein
VQALVREGLEGLFPKQCKEWHVRKKHVHEIFMQERREKNSAVARDLADTEESLQHVLREEVVDHVISIFPYVLVQSYPRSNAEGVFLIQVIGSWWPLFQRKRDGKYGPSMCEFH